MPSAANVKIDKQISPDNALADTSGINATPLRQAITTIEHKIRNLEKRKSKLESYKELQNAGKELNADQKTAVAKFNEVIQTLDFARDLCKQFLSIAAVSEKEAKKLSKKEAAAKNQAELARLREILLVQDALNQMGNETVREDFLQGRNGAAQLTDADIKLLDDLYPAVTPKHEAGNPTAFTNEVQAAAEHLLAVVDGKPKEVFGGTYSQVKEILGKIHESGYFDQAQVYEGFVEGSQATTEQPPLQQQPEIISAEHVGLNQELLPVEEQLSSPPIVVADSFPMQPQPVVVDVPPQPQQVPLVEAVLPPEQQQQIFYQQQSVQAPPQPPPQQPLRPITEMLGSGSFFFLQESEIDPPQQNEPQQAVTQPPQPIPSQTFTNQSFVSGGPPPPIPLPLHFQPIPNNMTAPPPNLPGSVNNIIDDVTTPVTTPAAQPPQQQQQPSNNKPAQSVVVPPVVEEMHNKSGVHHHHHGGGGPPNHHHHHRNAVQQQRLNNSNNNTNNGSHHQSNFYQNNNGYSSQRPRQAAQHRNGPRTAGSGSGNNNNRH